MVEQLVLIQEKLNGQLTPTNLVDVTNDCHFSASTLKYLNLSFLNFQGHSSDREV